MKTPQNYDKMVDVSFLVTIIIYAAVASSGYTMFGPYINEEVTHY